MNRSLLHRRRLLGLGYALAAGTALATTARAFEIQEASPGTRALYRLACEAPAKHVQLLAEIDAQLAGRQLSAAEIQAIKDKATCPLCGCALSQADHVLPGGKPGSDSTL